MLKTLLRIRLMRLVGRMTVGKSGAKTSVKRTVAMLLVYLYIALTFLFVSFSSAASIAPILIALELDWLYFTLFFLATFTLVLLFGVFEAKSELFDAKDNDLLLSLPIPARVIFLARLLTVLLYNYLTAAILLFPAIGVYLAFGGPVASLFGGLLGFLVFPLLATAIATLLGYALAYISARVKNRSAVTVVLTVAFLVLYFWGYNAMLSGIGDMASIGSLLGEKLAFLRFVGELGTLSSLSSVLLVLGVSVLLVTFVYLWLSKNYFAMAKITPVAQSVSRRAGRVSERTSPVRALVKKELSRFLSSGLYMTNTSIGLLFEIFLAAVLLVKGNDLFVPLIALLGLPSDAVSLLVLGALLALVPMTCISAPALSLEGKSLWILKSLPLSSRDVLTGKLLPHVIVSAPFHLVASVLAILATMPRIPIALLLLVLPQIASVGYGALGLFWNTLFPKFHFENEAQPVKQSLPVVLASLVPTFLSFAIVGGVLYLVLFGQMPLATILLTLLYLGITAISLALLYTVGARRYEQC